MTSRYKFYTTIQNIATGTPAIGFPISENFNNMFSTTSDVSYTIPVKFQYRPDLIANYFYGDPTLFWIIVNNNGITNSPEGFEVGTVIKIPYIGRVMELL
jgi:hypothetical protein